VTTPETTLLARPHDAQPNGKSKMFETLTVTLRLTTGMNIEPEIYVRAQRKLP